MKPKPSKKGKKNTSKKGTQNSTQNSTLSGVSLERKIKNPTKTENEILFLISKEFLTVKQIAIRRKCKERMVQRHVANLRKKGLINSANQTVRFFDPPSAANEPSNDKTIRLHGQQFTITILFKDDRYKEKIGKTITIDGNTIKCHRDIIEIYGVISFFADDPQKATAKSLEYWNRFFIRLEQDLKIILVKPRAQNIKLVSQHFARVGDDLAQECELRGDKLKIYANDDGKLWFTIDNSFNLHELETLHPQTAKEDMDTILKYFNDMRDNKPPTLSDLTKLVFNLTALVLKNQIPIPPPEPIKKEIPRKDDPMYG
jgi:hypothetical protein